MSSQTATLTRTVESPSPSDETLERVFADERRRVLLDVLGERPGVLELDRLTELVVEAELDGDWAAFDEDRFDRTLVALHREHLPLLEAAGFLDVDRDADGVFVSTRPATFEQVF